MASYAVCGAGGITRLTPYFKLKESTSF